MNACPAPAPRPVLPEKLPLDRASILRWLDDLVVLIEETLEGQELTRDWDAYVALQRMEEAAVEAIALLAAEGDRGGRVSGAQGELGHDSAVAPEEPAPP
jgi:hypothetical protein